MENKNDNLELDMLEDDIVEDDEFKEAFDRIGRTLGPSETKQPRAEHKSKPKQVCKETSVATSKGQQQQPRAEHGNKPKQTRKKYERVELVFNDKEHKAIYDMMKRLGEYKEAFFQQEVESYLRTIDCDKVEVEKKIIFKK